LVEVHHTERGWREPSQNLGIACEFLMDGTIDLTDGQE